MIDPSRHILEQAIAAQQNGQARPVAPPPLELVLGDCHLGIAEVASPGADKALVVTHASGGLRVVIPMSNAAAREVGNALCGRPNIEIPE